jgi:putative membrane protein
LQKRVSIAKTSWLNGALAGFAATAPMTLFMLGTHRCLPRGQRYDLPPEIITRDLARIVDVHWRLNKKQTLAATTLAHFGYGAAAGALYGPLEKNAGVLPGAVKGSLFGLLVWMSSYLVLLPLLGLVESGRRETSERNMMMVAAHIVWGATLGWLVERRRQTEGGGGELVSDEARQARPFSRRVTVAVP